MITQVHSPMPLAQIAQIRVVRCPSGTGKQNERSLQAVTARAESVVFAVSSWKLAEAPENPARQPATRTTYPAEDRPSSGPWPLQRSTVGRYWRGGQGVVWRGCRDASDEILDRSSPESDKLHWAARRLASRSAMLIRHGNDAGQGRPFTWASLVCSAGKVWSSRY